MLAVDQVLQRQTAPDSLPLAALLEQVHNLSMLDSAPMCSTEHLLFVLLMILATYFEFKYFMFPGFHTFSPKYRRISTIEIYK